MHDKRGHAHFQEAVDGGGITVVGADGGVVEDFGCEISVAKNVGIVLYSSVWTGVIRTGQSRP